MASKFPTDNPTCPVCLESPPVLKMLRSCRHVFCETCLSKHLKGLGPETKVISCPTCFVESPLPVEGVSGLADYSKYGVEDISLQEAEVADSDEDLHCSGSENDSRDDAKGTFHDSYCTFCKYKASSQVKAINTCDDCGQLPMFDDCTVIHGMNKATRHHRVFPLKKINRKNARCQTHNELKKYFCCDCSKLVCPVCVLFEHIEHDVGKAAKVCKKITKNTMKVKTEREGQLEDMKNIEASFKEMDSSGLAAKNAVVKRIEEHTEKWIEEILRQKTAMIAKVNDDYTFIEDRKACLEKIQNVIQQLDAVVRWANRLVSRHEPHPADLERLATAQKNLVTAGQLIDQIDGSAFIEVYNLYYKSRQRNLPIFRSNLPKIDIGKITYAADGERQGQQSVHQQAERSRDIQRCQGPEGAEQPKGSRDIQRCQYIFTKEYETDIHNIVNLGDRFAVAHGPSYDETEAIDVYNISGVQQQTIETHIDGLLPLALTTDKGTLLAVCDEGSRSYTIRMYDPVSGYIRSNPQFSVEGGVQGFDVCDGQQFVILHGHCDKVTVVDEDGSVVLTEDVEYRSFFISCGGTLAFISRGWRHVDVYEIMLGCHLKHIATSQRFDDVRDVSATADGEVTVTCRRDGRWCLGRATFKENKFSEWKYKDVDSRLQVPVSVGGDYVVVAGRDNNSRRRILRVFKEEV